MTAGHGPQDESPVRQDAPAEAQHYLNTERERRRG